MGGGGWIKSTKGGIPRKHGSDKVETADNG